MSVEFSPQKSVITPEGVFIIGTYDENGVPNAMNAAWGIQSDYGGITLFLGKHKTTDNIEKTGAFTAHDLAPGSGGSLFSPGTQTDGTAFAFSTITPPVILTIEKGQAEGSIVLTFTGQPGPFAVEQSSSLTPPSWSEVQGVVFSVPDLDGLSTAEFTVGPEVTHNFFRIRQQ